MHDSSPVAPTAAPAPAPKPATPRTPRLPRAAHAARVPAHLAAEQLERVRQAAYVLPQVVKPADLCPPDHPDAEGWLDEQGLVLLQKSVPGQRPSRWIAPDLFDAALRHLDACPVSRDSRAQLNERTAWLEAQGVSRNLQGRWERLVRRPLALAQLGWSVTVAFQAPVDAELVWSYFRHADERVLLASLGPVPAYPHADELLAHLNSLVERSEMCDDRHLDSLLPRLQSECALPQPIASLKAACTRAQDRWEHHVYELQTLAGLTRELAFQGYPDTFEPARQLGRQVTLYVGPPNSGKTHAAFERLALADKGAYLAPLRLLALEGRDRLVARGVPCSLLTGEESVPADGARVVSSTIEMVGTRELIDVAVIDEAQMIFDDWRGWAWTQAVVAVPAREVIIICSAYAVPALENLLGLCGESVQIRHFERKQHVQLLRAPVSIDALVKGDAVVAFSRRDVLMLRDQISQHGHTVSVVYGALPPEVRRREAERFASGESDILVATDAIGMGLNLPIRRVMFSTMSKYDGVADRELTESEVHQIAGRAGRFGMHEEGWTGVLKEAESGAGRVLKELLPRQPRAPRNFKAPVAPNGWHIHTIASRLGKNRLHEVLHVFMEQLELDNAHFQVAQLQQMLELAEELDRVAAPLSLKERFTYAQAPVDLRTEQLVQAFLGWAASHAHNGTAGEPWFLDEVDERSRLDRMEQALRACTLWLWLDLRFPGVYGHLEDVLDLRNRLNAGIERHLKGKKPLWQSRRGGRP
ncbi:ATP-dependent RNA helicase SUPV3L1/SUV3 [Sphaerotilus hippei]|uniref:ATP-dependent RNA helicase SUPV3L1/SUV3 n=1 Tax=Sphaerotilus hippei TaxID=744406 RepID=A0A318H5V3_9BURK|nr:helicase-related protein [Sphaerotilus hippei]PXW92340.1 ATP-dependent RNA helicase SUPV3L1/SUV3 [Sphaerotilus hippei]